MIKDDDETLGYNSRISREFSPKISSKLILNIQSI